MREDEPSTADLATLGANAFAVSPPGAEQIQGAQPNPVALNVENNGGEGAPIPLQEVLPIPMIPQGGLPATFSPGTPFAFANLTPDSDSGEHGHLERGS